MSACRAYATVAFVVLLCSWPAPWNSPAARCRVADAKQYGISYLPLMLMEADQLIEKRARPRPPRLKVSWSTFHQRRHHERRDPLRQLHFASGGVGRWRRSGRAAGAQSSQVRDGHERDALYSTPATPTSKPSRTSPRRKDRTAGVKVSIQAVTCRWPPRGNSAGQSGPARCFQP